MGREFDVLFVTSMDVLALFCEWVEKREGEGGKGETWDKRAVSLLCFAATTTGYHL